MADDEESSYVRLHITPLDKSLLTAIIPPSILPRARNISYHEVQTFPERPYGYVELPTMDAEKVKKRLLGSILKGTKVKIETARPKEEATEKNKELPKPKKDKAKKRKRDEIPAVEIGDRQVKRGWTVPAAKIEKKNMEKQAAVKSKYSSRPECLFKTVLPENVPTTSNLSKTTKKDGKRGKQAVVHEFAKTTRYATFLRSNATGGSKKAVAEYVEGKGWLDEDGNVIEIVTRTSKRNAKIIEGESNKVEAEAMGASEQSSFEKASSDEEDEPKIAESSSSKEMQQKLSVQESNGSSESSASSSDSSSDDDSVAGSVVVPKTTQVVEKDENDSLSETSSSEDESEDEHVDEKEQATTQPSLSSSSSSSDSGSSSASSSGSDSETEQILENESRSQSSSGPSGLSITIPTVQSTDVHPLEALYKRRKSDASNQFSDAVPATFSFFGADANDEDEEGSLTQVPLTPFTQRDFESRGLRSAAPTPDTSHANKRFLWPVEGADGEDWDEDAAPSSPTRKEGKEKTDVNGGGEETEFQKWFYEHRGEANRAWKKRRKVVAKEKRQRENRKRGERL